MAGVDQAMILAADQRANRKPLEAARTVGIGKTTLYREPRTASPGANPYGVPAIIELERRSTYESATADREEPSGGR
jgi:hypothetical protein